jgi:hypothetical protein
MIHLRTLAVVALWLVGSPHPLYGQDVSGYREFLLGGDLPSVSALTGVATSAARTIHVRPALMQELDWRPRNSVGGTSATQADPAQQIVFSFYNDQLSRVTVDCNHTIFANNASIAGHVNVGDYVVLGGFTAVHQFCRLGAHSMMSMFSYVTKDIPAYVTVSGRPAEPRGVNSEGLKRRGFTPEMLRNIREAYRTLYRAGLTLEEALTELEARATSARELLPLIESVRAATRGQARCRPHRWVGAGGGAVGIGRWRHTP